GGRGERADRRAVRGEGRAGGGERGAVGERDRALLRGGDAGRAADRADVARAVLPGHRAGVGADVDRAAFAVGIGGGEVAGGLHGRRVEGDVPLRRDIHRAALIAEVRAGCGERVAGGGRAAAESDDVDRAAGVLARRAAVRVDRVQRAGGRAGDGDGV